MIKYKISCSHLYPGRTYLFEWPDSSSFEGIYLRRNTINSTVFLFKTINTQGNPPVFVPKDPALQECVWLNDSSWKSLGGIWEVNKPDFVKPDFDKKEDFAAALVFDGLEMHGMDVCPQCGKEGKFIKMALVCPDHGVFGGI